MSQYLSPGVYVKEVPSASQPIVGVGTSTAGFIGTMPDKITVLPFDKSISEELKGDGTKKNFDLTNYPVLTDKKTYNVLLNKIPVQATLSNDDNSKKSTVTFVDAPAKDATILVNYTITTTAFKPVDSSQVELCTNFSEFKKHFGDFSEDKGQNQLAHAVYGFFSNGGTRCYVAREKKKDTIQTTLDKFEAIDEIAIVAAPGLLDLDTQVAILDHCEQTEDRFAILDGQEVNDFTIPKIKGPVRDSDYGALYFPRLKVFDPFKKENITVHPSGHIAGIFAKVDTERGVHKAPANEVIRGVVGLESQLSRSHQDGLNPAGINIIRNFKGNITIWGARTLGGDANGEWKYINIRRYFLYLRESIEDNTRWVVFEPNDLNLWQKIRRNIIAFLMTEWRNGALFGATPGDAFYVKCDEETNPEDVRDKGQVVTEIGVAIVKPAEFVIFRITQKAGSAV